MKYVVKRDVIPFEKKSGQCFKCFKTTPLLFIETKRYDDVRSSEKCEAHLLKLFALSISPSALCLVPVLCGYLNFQRTAGYGSVFSRFESLEKAVRSNSLENQEPPVMFFWKYVRLFEKSCRFQFFGKKKEPSVMGF